MGGYHISKNPLRLFAYLETSRENSGLSTKRNAKRPSPYRSLSPGGPNKGRQSFIAPNRTHPLGVRADVASLAGCGFRPDRPNHEEVSMIVSQPVPAPALAALPLPANDRPSVMLALDLGITTG